MEVPLDIASVLTSVAELCHVGNEGASKSILLRAESYALGLCGIQISQPDKVDQHVC